MRKYFPLLRRCAGAFLGMLLAMNVLLYLAYALPGQPVREHVNASRPLLEQEGMYPEFFGVKLFQMDNYTDTLMLFEAATADDDTPLQSMYTNRVYGVENFEQFNECLDDYMDNGAAECAFEPFDYNRYWHGYLVLLRPLLLFLNLAQIRVLNYICFFALLLWLLRLLHQRVGRGTAVLFALCQLMVSCFFVPHQLQFSWCFYIAYAGCLAVLTKTPRTAEQLFLVLLCCGGITAYLDLLVTPIITAGLPLSVWLLRDQSSAKRRLGTVVAGSVFWGAGYGAVWGSKWLLSALVTGENVLGDAVNQMGVRTVGDTWKGMELTWPNILGYMGDTLTERGLLWPLLICAVLAVLLIALCQRSREATAREAGQLLVAAMPLAWYAVLKAHSIQHGWFTWRAVVVLLFAAGVFVLRTCSVQTGLARIRFRGGNHHV